MYCSCLLYTARKTGAHRSYKALGYVHELQAQGIDDPISFYQQEVIKLNQEFQAAKAAKKARHHNDQVAGIAGKHVVFQNADSSVGHRR